MNWRRWTVLAGWLFGLCLISAPAGAAEELERTTPLLLGLPFVGVYSYQNGDRASYRPGPRVGGLVGARLLPWLSLNGEITYDKSWIVGLEGQDPSESFVDFAFSPLLHWRTGRIELVAGPEIGYFTSSSTETSMANGGEISSSTSGLAIGLNAGVFAPVNQHVSLGGLVSLEMRNARRYCETQAGMPETCASNQSSGLGYVLHDADSVAVTFAALF